MSNEIIASKIPALNGFGQNGFQGASSDLPGQRTTSDFLPDCKVPEANLQTRHVKGEHLPLSHGMRDRAAEAPAKIPDKTSRR